MKCPYCGSTAQTRLETHSPHLSRNEKILTESWFCGCGCHFDVDYVRDENDHWVWEETHIDWVTRKE